ncbi:hypothetical protein ACFSQ7_06905 [Paenibacillus rhizoplanae]
MTIYLPFYAYCLFDNDDTLTTLGPAGCNRLHIIADSTGFNDEVGLFICIFPSKISRPNFSGRLKIYLSGYKKIYGPNFVDFIGFASALDK